jgi:hypothetical protein
VAFGNGRLAAYDATADRWEVLIEADPGRLEELPLCMVYDPVNGRLVGCGYPEDAVGHQAGVIEAFDIVTREWTVLLGPTPSVAFACPPGSTPDTPGPIDQARPVIGNGVASMAFDRRAGRLVALADGHASLETWTFDVCTNTWTRMHPEPEPPPDTGQLVYDVDSDVTIASDGVRMWAYDLGANTWTLKGPFAPVAQHRFESLRFYDPVSGHVVASANNNDRLQLELWSYDVETDTWTPIPQAEPLAIGPHYEFFAYDASVDRLVAYTNGWGPPDPDGNRLWEAKTWLFDLRTGTWSGTGAVTPPGFTAGMWGQEPAIAYDEAAQRTVMLGQGQSAAYDATADRWEALYGRSTAEDWWVACGTRPECRQLPFVVYDPVNERLVAYGGTVYTSKEPGWVSPDDVLAFDTRTREWTLLLAGSGR